MTVNMVLFAMQFLFLCTAKDIPTIKDCTLVEINTEKKTP